jgi:hypothetical protein
MEEPGFWQVFFCLIPIAIGFIGSIVWYGRYREKKYGSIEASLVARGWSYEQIAQFPEMRKDVLNAAWDARYGTSLSQPQTAPEPAQPPQATVQSPPVSAPVSAQPVVQPQQPVSLEEALQQLPRLVQYQHMRGKGLPVGINEHGTPVWFDIQGDTLHIGVYGISGSGKDNLLRCWFLALAQNHTPDEVQCAILDGKGDWLTPNMASLAHMFIPPAGGYGKVGDERILEAVQMIDAETERRQTLINGLECLTREEYVEHTGKSLPLLVVIASDVMTSVKDDVEELLTNLVSKARSAGIRVIVSMQTPTGRDTRWRTNLSTVLAGSMVSGSQDSPALGIKVDDMRYRPSHLPDSQDRPGVFVLRRGKRQMLVQAPFISREVFKDTCNALPRGTSVAGTDYTASQPAAQPPVFTDKHRKVSQLLQDNPSISIRGVAKELYDGKSGGEYSRMAKEIMQDVVALTGVRSDALVQCERDASSAGVQMIGTG